MTGVRDPETISAIRSERLRTSRKDLRGLCDDVANAVASPVAERSRRVAAALLPYLGIPDLLGAEAYGCSPDRYMRHLIDTGPDYTLLSLVWRPRQMSPIHGHRTWCAFGMHRGSLVESFFQQEPDGALPKGCVQRRVGDTAHFAACKATAHRLANLCVETAVSLHVYGAAYDQIGNEVNQVWAE